MSGEHTTRVHIKDGNDRPFWADPQWGHIIDPYTSPIALGPEGWELLADETLRIELRNANPDETTDHPVTVIIRGVLEVEDGR
jgi:hypothetical protein